MQLFIQREPFQTIICDWSKKKLLVACFFDQSQIQAQLYNSSLTFELIVTLTATHEKVQVQIIYGELKCKPKITFP